MPYLDAAIVVFLIALSLSFLLRGVFKKPRDNRSDVCSTRSCNCSAKQTVKVSRE